MLFQPRQSPFLSVPSIMQNWLLANYPGFIEQNDVWSAMLEKYHELQTKPKTIDELKVILYSIWEELPCTRTHQ